MRRTKPYLSYKKTKNIRVIQLLLGHKKLEITVRYLGIEADDALELSESIEVSGCQGCNSSPLPKRTLVVHKASSLYGRFVSPAVL